MELSTLQEYAVRCAIRLGEVHPNGTLAASRIAELEGLSVEYVSKIMHLFRKKGFVTASRGTQGGFSLSVNPSTLTLTAIFDALTAFPSSNKTNDFDCSHFKGSHDECTHRSAQCQLKPIWGELFSWISLFMNNITLSDLMSREADPIGKMRRLALGRLAGPELGPEPTRLSAFFKETNKTPVAFNEGPSA